MPEKFIAFVRVGDEFWALFDYEVNIVSYAADESEVKSRYLVHSQQEVKGWSEGWDLPPRTEGQRRRRKVYAALLAKWPVPHPDPEFDPY